MHVLRFESKKYLNPLLIMQHNKYRHNKLLHSNKLNSNNIIYL
jgi:hypothetical protein